MIQHLPQDLFLHMISYLGPTKDLLSLTLVSRPIHALMEQIGDSVANTIIGDGHFRTFLRTTAHYIEDEDPSAQYLESNLCVVVRHAKYVETVRCIMQTLRSFIAQGFALGTGTETGTPLTEEEPARAELDEAYCIAKSGCRKRKRDSGDIYTKVLANPWPREKKEGTHTRIHVRSRHARNTFKDGHNNRVDMGLHLLSSCLGFSCPPFVNVQHEEHSLYKIHPSISFSTLNHFLHRSCPRSIEKKFLNLCGHLSSLLYTFIKARVAQRLRNVPPTRSFLEQEGDCDLNGDSCLDEKRLAHFRGILHHVFLRVVEIHPMPSG